MFSFFFFFFSQPQFRRKILKFCCEVCSLGWNDFLMNCFHVSWMKSMRKSFKSYCYPLFFFCWKVFGCYDAGQAREMLWEKKHFIKYENEKRNLRSFFWEVFAQTSVREGKHESRNGEGGRGGGRKKERKNRERNFSHEMWIKFLSCSGGRVFNVTVKMERRIEEEGGKECLLLKVKQKIKILYFYSFSGSFHASSIS